MNHPKMARRRAVTLFNFLSVELILKKIYNKKNGGDVANQENALMRAAEEKNGGFKQSSCHNNNKKYNDARMKLSEIFYNNDFVT